MFVRIPLIVALALLSDICLGFFGDWAMPRSRDPVCIPIPTNLTLCQNIGYNKMRLPNLLDHDSLQEVGQQAAAWVSLLNIRCHPDSQLFLCSLFAPVCLDRPIFPCRSLCNQVKGGCERTMAAYGFPWPPMLDCHQFPMDNDMCITRQSLKTQEEEEEEDVCKAKTCNLPTTYENMLDSYCQANYVARTRIKHSESGMSLGHQTSTVFKTWPGAPLEMSLRLASGQECCSDWLRGRRRRQAYLVMGKKAGSSVIATFVRPWSRSKDFRRARRAFQRIDCNKRVFKSQRMMTKALDPYPVHTRKNKTKSSRRKKQQRNRCRRRRYRN